MSIPTSFIREESATGEEIHKIISAIEPALMDFPPAHVAIACLTVAVVIQNPNISPEALQICIKETSQFMCLMLQTTQKEDEKKVVLN